MDVGNRGGAGCPAQRPSVRRYTVPGATHLRRCHVPPRPRWSSVRVLAVPVAAMGPAASAHEGIATVPACRGSGESARGGALRTAADHTTAVPQNAGSRPPAHRARCATRSCLAPAAPQSRLSRCMRELRGYRGSMSPMMHPVGNSRDNCSPTAVHLGTAAAISGPPGIAGPWPHDSNDLRTAAHCGRNQAVHMKMPGTPRSTGINHPATDQGFLSLLVWWYATRMTEHPKPLLRVLAGEQRLAAAGLADAPGRALPAGVPRHPGQGGRLRRLEHHAGPGRRGDAAADPPLWLRRGDPVQRHPDAAVGTGSGAGIPRRGRPGAAAAA